MCVKKSTKSHVAKNCQRVLYQRKHWTVLFFIAADSTGDPISLKFFPDMDPALAPAGFELINPAKSGFSQIMK